jgi:predicted MPP superfamily phosphohydrolase
MAGILSRRAFLKTTVAAVPVLTGLYTWRVEPTWLEITHRDLLIAHLPPALAGKTLVQVSDIHIGPQVDDDYIRRTFAAVTALAPDFVVHTGDLVSYDGPAVIEQAKPLMAGFPRGQLGTVAILGNHDYGLHWADPKVADQVSALFTANGARVLRNNTATIGGLQFAGCDDLWTNHFAPAPALRALKAGEPSLVLCHNPDACDLDIWADYQGWILAGHTHGGQCKPPFLPPPLLPVKNRRYTAGEFALTGGRKLYISRGIGHLQRVRFNVRPEVTVFRLMPA